MILIINNRSHFINDLEIICKDLGAKVKVIDKSDIAKVRGFKKYKGVILSGGPLFLDQKVYVEDIEVDLEWLLQFNGPILGICLGHQIIGEAFGGKIKRLKSFVNKREKIKILHQSPIFKGLKKTFEAQEAHHDVISRMPPNFRLIATSKTSKYEAMEHKERPIFSTQFHPEVSGGAGVEILKNFLHFCGEIK